MTGLARTTRIAVLGAGCAGLTVADELRIRGFTAVTVFEADQRAGGKIRTERLAETSPSARGLFEAGTVFFIPSEGWSRLLQRHDVSHHTVAMPRVQIGDLATGQLRAPVFFANGFGLLRRVWEVARFLRLLDRYGPAVDARPGLAPHAPGRDAVGDLAEPTGPWFARRGLRFVRSVLLPIAGGAQFGPLIDVVPAVYAVRLLTLLRRYPLWAQLTLTMPQLRVGHEVAWTRAVAANQVRLGTPVLRLRRDDAGVEITTPAGSERFDQVVVALPPAVFRTIADVDEDEAELFTRVRTLDRVVVTARVRGLPDPLFCAPRYAADGRVPPGHPYLFYTIEPGSGVYTFHPFLDGGTTLADAEAAVRDVVRRLGGEVVDILHRTVVGGWFPHFDEADVRTGALGRLAALQGKRRTWHVGEVVAGIGVPHGTEQALDLVARFAGEQPAPRVWLSTPQRLADLAMVLFLLAAAAVIICTTHTHEPWCALGIWGLALLATWRWHDRASLWAGFTGMVVGTVMEICAVAAGLWAYPQPVFAGLTWWVAPMWWMFPLAIRAFLRVVTATLPPHHDPFPAGVVLVAVVGWLCATGVAAPLLAMIGTLGLLVVLAWRARSPAAWLPMPLCTAIGLAVEFGPVQAGAWSYPVGPLAGMPLWLPVGYAVFGTALVRLCAATPRVIRASQR